jgi:hypothetical protein
LARNHPLASPLLSAGRRDAAVWTNRLRSGNFVWRHVLHIYAPLDRLPGSFRAGRSGWPKTQFGSTMGSFCMIGIRGGPEGAGWRPQGSLPDPVHLGPICEKSRFQDVEPTLLQTRGLTNRRVNQVLQSSRGAPELPIMGTAVRGGRLSVFWSPPASAASTEAA